MLTWEYLVDTVRDDLPFILSVGTGCAISASCLEKRKHFYLRVALTILLAFCWMYGTRPYVGLNMQGTRMGVIRYTTAFVLFMLSVPFAAGQISVNRCMRSQWRIRFRICAKESSIFHAIRCRISQCCWIEAVCWR